MAKLGFTFYPKDWWTSDTFFELESEDRYIFLECIFLMYQNEGYLTLTKEQIEKRLITQIKPKTWKKITQLLTKTDLGYTHNSIDKRRTKADSSRENGKKGGRPKKPNNPEKNPPLEYKEKENRKESKDKVKEYRKFAHLSLSVNEFNKLNSTYSKESIDSVLDSIENYAKNKNYKSLYLTSIKWLKKDAESTVLKNKGNAAGGRISL